MPERSERYTRTDEHSYELRMQKRNCWIDVLYIFGIKNSKFGPETLTTATLVLFIMRIGRRFYWSSPITALLFHGSDSQCRERRSSFGSAVPLLASSFCCCWPIKYRPLWSRFVCPAALLRILFHKGNRFIWAHLCLRLRAEKLHWNLMSEDRFSLCMHFRRGALHECNNFRRNKAIDSRLHARKVSGRIERLYVLAK